MSKSSGTRYRFFPGCLARLKLPHVERSVRTVLEMLGVELEDEPGFSCCPDPVVFRSASRDQWLALAGRNLALDSSAPIATLCPGCASSLAEARHVLVEQVQTDGHAGRAPGAVDPGSMAPGVAHFLEIMTAGGMKAAVQGRISRRLDSLRVACHYGCHLVRPSRAITFDDPEKPVCLDDLVALTGAQAPDYADKYLCCGRPSMDEATSLAIAEHKLRSMREAGCDLITVACPFCFEQFDLGQTVLRRKHGLEFEIPVVYATQLIGLAMGLGPEELGLARHRINPQEVLGLG
jgi:heterodisulfide reductase subunit B